MGLPFALPPSPRGGMPLAERPNPAILPARQKRWAEWQRRLPPAFYLPFALESRRTWLWGRWGNPRGPRPPVHPGDGRGRGSVAAEAHDENFRGLGHFAHVWLLEERTVTVERDEREGFSLPSISMKELLAESELLRGSTSCATGAVYLWRREGQCLLVKTFWRNGWFSRLFFGRRSVRNEWRMLTGLWEAGFRCAPRPYARIGGHTLVMEYVSGEELESLHHYARTGGAPPPPEFYAALREELRRLHQAGFVHGDFRRANVMVPGVAGAPPRIIDWATGMRESDGEHFLYRQLRGSDNYSLVKILKEAVPSLVTREEWEENAPGMLLRLGRFFRQKIYRGLFKPLFRRWRS